MTACRGLAAAGLCLILAGGCASGGPAAPGAGSPAPAPADPYDQELEGLERRDGLLVTYLDADQGKVWLEVPAVSEESEQAGDGRRGFVGEYLYVEGLVTGLGSNPVGLDRGQLGDARRVVLRRLGARLLVEEPNLAFRAASAATAERLATRESFAPSVLWAGAIEKTAADGRALVDLTPFLLRDAHGVVATLRQTGQGGFRLDPDRSAVDLDACLAFADNLEFEVLLTYASDEPGPHVRATVPTPEAFGLVQHYSFLRPPASGYQPRPFDPRSGSFDISFADYAAPLGESIERRWIVRHRLEKTDPAAERSAVVEPIVYYVDPAIPEPVRGAVIDGAGWWAAAFEAAGFLDAYRIELLPEGVHPLDARYNVIQWVHRSTRGWSYGGGVVDPLSGEMVKGHVNLGSLRVRQDRLIFEGLLGTAATGSGRPDDPIELALARIRQLAAHEVGHTLGLAHNFAASTYGRASVMDYPAPLVRLGEDGELDVSAAYGVGVGAWDLHAVRYAYSQFPAGTDEAAALGAIVRDGLDHSLIFLSDADARPAGAAQPLANLWDNGADPAAQLLEELRVRRHALDRFGERSVTPGTPLALLEEVFATVYLRHRYQLEAAAKLVGGVDYRYAVRGDGQPPAEPLAPERQRQGLAAVLAALDPAALDVSEETLGLLLPRPYGHGRNRELFAGATRPVFDALGAAATAADLALQGLLQPERAARLVDQHRRHAELPGLTEILDAIEQRLFATPAGESPRLTAVRQVAQRVAVERAIELSNTATAPVRAVSDAWLAALVERLTANRRWSPHQADLTRTVRRHLDRPGPTQEPTAPAADPPPGSPIGANSSWASSAPDLGACTTAPRWRDPSR